MEVNDLYNELPLHTKEAADMPLMHHQLTVCQQMFLEEIFEAAKLSMGTSNLAETKEELKAVLVELGSIVDEL